MAAEAVFALLLLADWGQTNYIGSHCYTSGGGEYKEINPLLAKCPQPREVAAYMLTAAALHAGITYALPPKYRKVWQASSIAVQAYTVVGNSALGIGWEFQF